MARGQRKTIEEKITAKQELIEALMTRVESEKRELNDLYQEKRKKELEAVSELIEESGLEPEEVAAVLQQYLEEREEAAS
jgi:1,6-anhydro-N-acetylmuramate kinase